MTVAVKDDTKPNRGANAARLAGIAFGVATQLGFLVTVWFLFSFLRKGSHRVGQPWLLVDLLLALQFTVIHSFLLYPAVRQRITQIVPRPFYGCLFCVSTCITLGMVFANWRSSEQTLWDTHGVAAVAMQAGFYTSWILLFYSLYLSGLGYQTGLTPWWYWLQRQPAPRRTFEIRGLYRWFRHPIYFSFLGLIWFTPRMTWDHAMLTGLWTVYIFVGSYLKDKRLVLFLGDTYRRYQEQVAGYPLVFFGPLGRKRPVAGTLAAIGESAGSLPLSRENDVRSKKSDRAA